MGKISPMKPMGDVVITTDSGMRVKNSRKKKRSGIFSGILYHFFHRDKRKSADNLEHYLNLCKKGPENAPHHLKLGAIYQKEGEGAKAIAEYLRAAELFSRDHFFAQAMAIYKQVLSLNPHLVQANQKMAETYKKMGLLADAVSQYKIVARHYVRWGRKEKLQEITNLIHELESLTAPGEKKAQGSNDSIKIPGARPETLSLSASKMASLTGDAKRDGPWGEKGEKRKDGFDLRTELESNSAVELRSTKEVSIDKLSGFEEIFKELQETAIPREVYPNFNYHMGVACREMGFNDGAIEQFQIAFENSQNPLETARMLSKCLREKGCFEEAQKYFEKAMQLEINSEKGPLGFKGELVLVNT